MKEAPGDGSDFVEKSDRGGGLGGVDRTNSDKQSQVGVDLFGRAVGDAVAVEPVASGPPPRRDSLEPTTLIESPDRRSV